VTNIARIAEHCLGRFSDSDLHRVSRVQYDGSSWTNSILHLKICHQGYSYIAASRSSHYSGARSKRSLPVAHDACSYRSTTRCGTCVNDARSVEEVTFIRTPPTAAALTVMDAMADRLSSCVGRPTVWITDYPLRERGTTRGRKTRSIRVTTVHTISLN